MTLDFHMLYFHIYNVDTKNLKFTVPSPRKSNSKSSGYTQIFHVRYYKSNATEFKIIKTYAQQTIIHIKHF